MFGKLLKYDLRTMFRIFLPIWGAILILAAVNGVTIPYSNQINGAGSFLLVTLPLLLIFLGSMAAVVFAVVFVIMRFYKGLLGDAGYLMFTLPVRTGALVGAKALSALLMEAISAVVAGLSALLMVSLQAPTDIGKFFSQFVSWARDISAQASGGGWVVAEAVLLGLFVLAEINLRLYTAMAIGHLGRSRRVLLSVAAYVGIGIVLSILSAILLPGLTGWSVLFSFDTLGSSVHSAACLLGVGIGREAVLCAAFFFATTGILAKRLNLE